MIFSPPNEAEFFERGFGYSSQHDGDEAVISYVRTYEDGTELIVTFEIGLASTVYVKVSKAGQDFAEVTVENLSNVSFQSWQGSRVLRVSFKEAHLNTDLRINYEPRPSIHLASLASGA